MMIVLVMVVTYVCLHLIATKGLRSFCITEACPIQVRVVIDHLGKPRHLKVVTPFFEVLLSGALTWNPLTVKRPLGR